MGENEPQAATSPMRDENWIACELHDGMLQWVLSARMQLESVARQLAALDSAPEQTVVQVEMTRRILESAADEGRRLVSYLESHVPETRGSQLSTQLHSYVMLMQPEAKKHGQVVSVDVDNESWPSHDTRVQWNILRVLQQAIANAVRHAGPCSIKIGYMRPRPGLVTYTVSDDGAGFDTSAKHADRFGISGMRQRAKLIQSEFELTSQPGQGTSVSLT
ncbi:MAG: ATP-binding protein, partial [Planctomycetota bacterium]